MPTTIGRTPSGHILCREAPPPRNPVLELLGGRIAYRKVGSIRFIKIGRLTVSWSIAKRRD